LGRARHFVSPLTLLVSSILRVAIRFSYERMQEIRPLLQLSDPQVQDITYANHADELFSIFNWNMPNIVREHRRGHVRNAVIRRTGYHGLRHKRRHRHRVQVALVLSKAVGEISLGDHPFDRPSITAHDCRADALLTQATRQHRNRIRRPDSDDPRALRIEDARYFHAIAPAHISVQRSEQDYGVARVIGNKKCTCTTHRHADGSALSSAAAVQEAGQQRGSRTEDAEHFFDSLRQAGLPE